MLKLNQHSLIALKLQAAREGNVKVIKRYISSVHFKRKLDKVGKGGKNPIDTPDGEGFTAMHYAARYNNIDVMELLLEHGAGEEYWVVILVSLGLVSCSDLDLKLDNIHSASSIFTLTQRL